MCVLRVHIKKKKKGAIRYPHSRALKNNKITDVRIETSNGAYYCIDIFTLKVSLRTILIFGLLN